MKIILAQALVEALEDYAYFTTQATPWEPIPEYDDKGIYVPKIASVDDWNELGISEDDLPTVEDHAKAIAKVFGEKCGLREKNGILEFHPLLLHKFFDREFPGFGDRESDEYDAARLERESEAYRADREHAWSNR